MGEAKRRGTYEQRRDKAVEMQSRVENVFGKGSLNKFSPKGRAALLMVAAMAIENEKTMRILKGEN